MNPIKKLLGKVNTPVEMDIEVMLVITSSHKLVLPTKEDNLQLLWMYGINDLDIWLDRKTLKYHIGIETIYFFDTIESEKNYINSLFDIFEEWFLSGGGIINRNSIHNALNSSQDTAFDTLEDLYWWFRTIAKGL